MPKRWGCPRRRSSGSPNSGMPCGGSGATWLAPHSFVNRDHGSVGNSDFGVRDLRQKAWNRAASRLREMRARRRRASSACPAGSGYLPAPPGPRPKPHPINLAYKGRRNTKLFTAGKGGENVCGRRCLPSSEIPGSGKVRAPPFAREFTDALALGARFPKRSAGAFHSFPDGFKEGARSRQMHPSWSGQVGSEAFPGSVR